MAASNSTHSLLSTVRDQLAPVHSDAYKFLAAGVLAMLIGWWLWSPFGWLLAIATAWVAYFFRDPARTVPQRASLVLAPADGRVSSIERVRPPVELGLGDAERVRVSTFLSVFDVHINRTPVPGKIIRSIYVPGAFLNAALDKASEENERRAVIVRMADERDIAVVQIAGLVARRIVTFVGEGASVKSGERIGLIRFGSRVDVYLPPGHHALVGVGQLAVGGETVLADLASSEPEREARLV